MAHDTFVEYTVLIGPNLEECPLILKTGTTKAASPVSPPEIFKEIEYFFVDTQDKVYLYLVPSQEQLIVLKGYSFSGKVYKVDLAEATGAAKYQLRGKKALIYRKEWAQPAESHFQKDEFIVYLNTHGVHATSTFLVSNWTDDEMSHLHPSGNDSGIGDSAAEHVTITSSISRLNLGGGI